MSTSQATSPSDFVTDEDASRRAISRARLLFLVAAFVSFLFSVTLWFTGSKEQGLFVGLWVPSILSLGCLVLNDGGRR
ncbi:MAG: hypothetical protein DWQ30_19785 [Acidobacteria bacterium]|nr:MAG: hypothetical protein DWQ30_19785 [Acidobacteriota bacterium]